MRGFYACLIVRTATLTRFCSRCGISISGAAEWLAGEWTSCVMKKRNDHISVTWAIRYWARSEVNVFWWRPGACFLFFSLPGGVAIPMLVQSPFFFCGVLMLYARFFGEISRRVVNSQVWGNICCQCFTSASIWRIELVGSKSQRHPGFDRAAKWRNTTKERSEELEVFDSLYQITELERQSAIFLDSAGFALDCSDVTSLTFSRDYETTCLS